MSSPETAYDVKIFGVRGDHTLRGETGWSKWGGLLYDARPDGRSW